MTKLETTRSNHRSRLAALVATAAMLLASMAAQAQSVTQSFTLQNGWNAIYLEVSPADGSPATLFAGLPLASIWSRVDRLSSADFIQNPAEADFNEAGWLRWCAPPQPAFINDLRELQAHRAYLVKLTNGPVNWQVTGQPVVRPVQWATDAWNLRGFPVTLNNPPTFRAYFQSSQNHYDTTQAKLRGVYRLGANGIWAPANQDAPMRAGEACWVYCQGASSFTAPFEVRLDASGKLDFGQELERIDVEFRNLAPGSRTVTLSQSPFVPGLLAYKRFNSATGFEWVDLPHPYVVAVTNGSPKPLSVAIRRSRMAAASFAGTLEAADGQGIRYTIPVAAARFGLNYAGLWVGDVTVNRVSEPHFGALTTNLYALVNGNATPLTDASLMVTTNQMVLTNADDVVVTTNLLVVQTLDGTQVPVYEKVERSTGAERITATKSEFTMRLLMHVDAGRNVRLLKEVVQMWRDGTYTNDAQGYQVVDKPGAYVLLTRDNLLGQFKGSMLRDGVSVGKRLSAIGFDFDGHGTNDLELTGTFGPGQALTGVIEIGSEYPLNPFRHKYHPDHDNLDPQFEAISDPARKEAYAVTRQLRFELAVGTSGPDPAYSAMEGVYHETLNGLHKQPIKVQGTFRLSRASYIAELNPSPNP